MLIGMVAPLSNLGALVLLRSERASICKPSMSSCRPTVDSGAANTKNYPWRMARDSGDFTASGYFALIGALHWVLLPVCFFSSGEGWERALAGACCGEVVAAGTALQCSFLLWLLIITLSPAMKILVTACLTGTWWRREISQTYHNWLNGQY